MLAMALEVWTQDNIRSKGDITKAPVSLSEYILGRRVKTVLGIRKKTKFLLFVMDTTYSKFRYKVDLETYEEKDVNSIRECV